MIDEDDVSDALGDILDFDDSGKNKAPVLIKIVIAIIALAILYYIW